MMFAKEIQNKSIVSLYDNNLGLLTHGIITGYKESAACILINDSLYFPIKQVAKIVVHPPAESPFARISTRLRV